MHPFPGTTLHCKNAMSSNSSREVCGSQGEAPRYISDQRLQFPLTWLQRTLSWLRIKILRRGEMGALSCFQARRPVSPHPLLSQGIKTSTACCFPTSSFIFLPTSPCRALVPSHIAKVYGPPSCYLAGFYRLSPITVLGPLHEAFCSWPFPSGVLCCTSHPHLSFTTSSLVPRATAQLQRR